jgi:Flp pilus assembly protein TadD
VAAFAALALLARRSRAPLAGALFFVGSLFPTLGFFNVYAFIFSYVADHWQYLASIGLIAPACAGLALGSRRLGAGAGWAGAALVAVLAALTWRQAGMYSDMVTFYRTTIEKNPGAWMAHNNLGAYLDDHGLPGSVEEYEAALRVRPDYVPAHYNLGVALLRQGRPAEAVGHLEKALGTGHRDAVHLYLGRALARLHRDTEAEVQFAAAVRLEPDNAAAWFDLGHSLARQRRMGEAASAFATASRLDPGNPEPIFALGDALAFLGRYGEAADAYRRGLALAPDRLEPSDNLGIVLLMGGQVEAAVGEFRSALRRWPDDPGLRRDLQIALKAQSQAPGTQ